MSQNRKELDDLRVMIASHRDKLKANFGLIFWQLERIEDQIDPETLGEQGVNFGLESIEDAILGEFIAKFVSIWRSAGDFNAASRFVFSELSMTADELLQVRQLFKDSDK